MSAIVRVAVALLPASQRDRYREQWTADVRDAPEAGLSGRRVAWGALFAAIATNRPLQSVQLPAAADRSRFALGLAAASAALVLSSWGSTPGGGLTNNGTLDYFAFLTGGVLTAFGVIAPIVALALILGRRVTARIRVCVVLLVAVSASPYLYAALSSVTNDIVYLDAAAIPPALSQFVYPAAGILVLLIGASMLRTQTQISSSGRSAAPALIAGAISLVLAALALTGAVIAWAGRTPLAYGLSDTPENLPILQNWLALKIHYEALVFLVFVLVGAGSVVAAVIVTALAWRAAKRRFAFVTITALAAVVCMYAVLSDFIRLGADSASPQLATSLLLPLAQLLLAGAVLVGASGVRLRASREVVSAQLAADEPPLTDT